MRVRNRRRVGSHMHAVYDSVFSRWRIVNPSRRREGDRRVGNVAWSEERRRYCFVGGPATAVELLAIVDFMGALMKERKQ